MSPNAFVEGDTPESVEDGNLGRVGVINGAPCNVDGVCLECETVAEKSFDGEGDTLGLEGERKGEILEGGGRTVGLVGEADDALLVWDSKSRRGEG